MRLSGLYAATIVLFLLLIVCTPNAICAPVAPCSQGARAFLPCELSFDWRDSELRGSTSPYQDELLNVEFRSPRATTYLIRAFWDGGHALRVRFSPTEPGAWTYHVSSLVKRYDNQELSFNVAETANPGFIDVANVRHWRTTNKQPHLWLSAAAPFLEIDQSGFETWLDQRKHDGFTHVRGPLLTLRYREKPLSEKLQPNFAYFAALDDRLLAADTRGLTLDLLIADDSFNHSGVLANLEQRTPLVRYLVARYGALNITWQGLEHFDDVTNARTLLKELGSSLQKYDAFRHPRSTDARASSFPLLSDGWMNYLIESSPHPELGAIEHQFTAAPEIHVVNATQPEAFRHELWSLTTNAEYPSVSYEALRNEANVRAIQTWVKVISDTRHWELEPYFDVDGARAAGLEEVEYLAYAQKPGIVEITLPKHKYNPLWVNPITGEEIPLKDYKGEVFSRQTPDSSHDWVLQVPREGKKEHMLHSYYFESQDPPVQEIESDPAKTPFQVTDPPGDTLNPRIPAPFRMDMTKANRATRLMQFVWWGEIVPGDQGLRLLGVGSSGTFIVPRELIEPGSESLNLRVFAINANGKAYELDKVYRLTP